MQLKLLARVLFTERVDWLDLPTCGLLHAVTQLGCCCCLISSKQIMRWSSSMKRIKPVLLTVQSRTGHVLLRGYELCLVLSAQ